MIFYNPKHIEHKPEKEIDKGIFVKNADTPQRIEEIAEILVKNDYSIQNAKEFDESFLYLVHDKDYVEWIRKRSKITPPEQEYFPEVFGYDRLFDTGTPVTWNSYESALYSVFTALTAAEHIVCGNMFSYALCRPPGHHASKNIGGGYCYFNNAAIAAKYIQKNHEGNIAILDLDFHHGNGTQDIFYEDSSVLYVSLHGTPEIYFPWIKGFKNEIGEGKGEGYNLNIPLDPNTKIEEYLKLLVTGIKKINEFSPDCLIISLGLDIVEGDIQGGMNIKTEDYKKIGVVIKELNCPLLIVQEGGYDGKKNAEAVINLFDGLEIKRRFL